MKRILYLICSAALALWVAAGCGKVPAPGGDAGESTLTVDVGSLDAPTTRATAPTAGEKAVGSLSLYVFDSNGMLDASHTFTDAERTAMKATVRVKTGTKTVVALANVTGAAATAAAAAATLADLEAVALPLGGNSPSSLVMTARGEAAVRAGAGGTVSLSLTRAVARVSLGSVTNRLPAPMGAVTAVRAFLCNVVGNQSVKGDAAAQVWLNQEATPDHGGRDHVIGTGSWAAQEQALTFRTLGDQVALNATKSYSDKFFYCYPNALTDPNNGYNATFRPTATVLMVVLSIRGTDYYYPVALTGGLVRNSEYRVDLTVSGLGNTADDPFARIEKGDLAASVTVADWTTGATYTETI